MKQFSLDYFTSGKKEDKDQLVLDCEAFIHYMMIKFNVQGDQDEIYNDLVIETIKAIDAFNINYGFKFTTFLYKYLKLRIFRYNTKKKRSIKTKNVEDINVVLDSRKSIKYKFDEDKPDLWQTIKEILDERTYNIMVEHFYNKKIYRDIAEKYNMSRQNVSLIMIKGIKTLRESGVCLGM